MNQLTTVAELSFFGHCIPRTHNERPDIEQRISGIEQRAFIPLLRSLFLRGLLHLPHLGITAISAQQIVMRPALEHAALIQHDDFVRSEEHTPELQSLMRISYAVFCLKKKKPKQSQHIYIQQHT